MRLVGEEKEERAVNWVKSKEGSDLVEVEVEVEGGGDGGVDVDAGCRWRKWCPWRRRHAAATSSDDVKQRSTTSHPEQLQSSARAQAQAAGGREKR